MNYSYSIDDYGTLTLFTSDGRSICDISGCEKMNQIQIDELVNSLIADYENKII